MEKLILQALQTINEKLDKQGEVLKKHGKVLEQHGITLKEHGLILGALRNEQESLKASLSGLALQNAKEFGLLREQINDLEATIGVLKEDNWSNRKDIHRVKKKIGME